MAIAFVAGATASDATGVATTGSLGTVAVGQLVVVTVTDDSAGTTTQGVPTDNAGNTYTRVGALILNTITVGLYYSKITVGNAALAVKDTWSTAAASNLSMAAQYFNGFTGTPTLDQSTTTGTGSSTAATPATTSATVNANELVVIGAGFGGATTTQTLGTGYTNLSAINFANASSGQESKVVAATGTQTGVITLGASRAWGAAIATFQDVTGGAAAATYSTAMMMGV